MISTVQRKELYARMMEVIGTAALSDWEDIAEIIVRLKDSVPLDPRIRRADFYKMMARGTAFITFGYGIDGVTIEIAKYGRSLEELFKGQSSGSIHLIGGDFSEQTDNLADFL